MSKPVVLVSGDGFRKAAMRLALLDLARAAIVAMDKLPPEAFEPVEGRRLVVDSRSESWPEVPKLIDISKGQEPPAKQKWPSSSRQRFGKQ